MSHLQGVSLDQLLDGVSNLLDQWAQPDGPAFKPLPIINKSLVELLGKDKVDGTGQVSFIAGIRDAVDAVRATLRSGSNLQKFERDLNFELDSALDLNAPLGDRFAIAAAYDALIALSISLSGASSDDA